MQVFVKSVMWFRNFMVLVRAGGTESTLLIRIFMLREDFRLLSSVRALAGAMYGIQLERCADARHRVGPAETSVHLVFHSQLVTSLSAQIPRASQHACAVTKASQIYCVGCAWCQCEKSAWGYFSGRYPGAMLVSVGPVTCDRDFNMGCVRPDGWIECKR